MEAENAVNIVIYMPVAVATYGCVPIKNNALLNTNPGPSPKAEQRIAPMKDMTHKVKTFF